MALKGYQERIQDDLGMLGVRDVDPRHVEAFMRLEHPCLDGLSARQFQQEVVLSVNCIRTSGAEASEALADSFGL